MKESILFVLVFVSHAIAFSQPVVEEDITEILNQMTIEYEKHNIDYFDKLYHPNLLFTLPDGTIYSKDEILSVLKADSLITYDVQLSEIQIFHEDNLVYVSLVETFKFKDRDEYEESGRYSKVFVNEDGNWLLIAEHYSNIPKEFIKIELDSVLLNKFEGKYLDPMGKEYVIVASPNNLILKVNQQQIPFYAYAKNKFFVDHSNVTLEFIYNQGLVSHMILRPANDANRVMVKQ